MLSMAQPKPHAAAAPASPPRGVERELDALRQRGLAKILNKHFTETTRKLAVEKAAADAALRDLERRKAQTSEFTPSTNNEISPLDALYISVNQWRAECRRNEKETLLLYQSYVDKYGSAGYVQVPGCAPLTPPRKASARLQVTTPPTVSTAASLTPLSLGAATTADYPATPAAAATPTPVPNLAAAIESTLEDYLKRAGTIALPSIGQLGLESTYASEHDKEIQEFRNHYRQQLELFHRHDDELADSKQQSQTKLATFPEEQEGDDEEEELVKDHHHAAAPNTFLQSIENAVESPTATMATTATTITPEKAEELVQDNDEDGADCSGPIDFLQRNNDSDSDSVVSGLTVNSALTRRFIDDCERTVVTFFDEARPRILQQLEQEDYMNASSSSHVGSMSEVQSVQMQAAMQAESMARQMKEILEKFERDQEQASATDASSSVVTTRKVRENRPYPTNNTNEDWVVLYDATYDREYYHERKSGRTQWEPPQVVDDDISGDATSTTSRTTAVLSAAEVKPEVESRPVTRIELYRRKRRRQRKRRFAAAMVALGICVAISSYWIVGKPESALAKRFQLFHQQHIQPLLGQSVEDLKTAELLELAREEADRFRVLEEERVARETAEAERKMKLEQEAAERKAREDAELKAKEEADRKAAEEEEKRLKEWVAAEEAKKQAELWVQQQEELRRPPACNLPFAYAFHGKCRRLASANPLFDFQGLVEAMLQ